MKVLKVLKIKNCIFCRAVLFFILLFCMGSTSLYAGEGSGIKNKLFNVSTEVGDPVSAANGSFKFSLPLLHFGGAMPMDIKVFFDTDFCSICDINEMSPRTFEDSRFWLSPMYAGRFYQDPNTTKNYFSVILASGNTIVFKQQDNSWKITGKDDGKPPSPIPYKLKETAHLVFVVDPVHDVIMIFKKISSGRARIEEVFKRQFRYGENLLRYQYNFDDDNAPSSMTTSDKRSLRFFYSTSGTMGLLDRIEEDKGSFGDKIREVKFTYDNNAMLEKITDSMEGDVTISYVNTDSGKEISGITYPAGNTPYTQTYARVNMNGYDEVNRVTGQADAYGNLTKLSYDPNANKVTVQRPDNKTNIFEHTDAQGAPKGITDASGNTMNFGSNSNGQISSFTDRSGDITNITYNAESGKIASYTDAEGHVTSFTYTPQDQKFSGWADDCGDGRGCFEEATFTFYNLTKITYPDGTEEQFTYDDYGYLLTRIDQNGKTWTYKRDYSYNLINVKNPDNGETSYTYYYFHKVKTITDSDTGTTTFEYDDFRRVTKITFPDNTSREFTYNLNDKVTSFKNENNNTWTFSYDPNGNLTLVVDPDGNKIEYQYDLMDRISKSVNKMGKSINYIYDNMGRLSSFTDNDGIAFAYGYDPRGKINSLSIAGRQWVNEADKDGVPTSFNDSAGNTTSLETNKLGVLTGITDPQGQKTGFEYDSMSRLTKMTDPINREIQYGYDYRGLLTSVTFPVMGQAVYTRNNLGLLANVKDFNGKNWGFTYTTMGKLTGITDPMGNQTQFTYDNRGRKNKIIFPDNTSTVYERDGIGNIVKASYSDGSEHSYTYNKLNQLTGSGDISIERDAEGEITATVFDNITFGAAYTDGESIKTISYNNDAVTVLYTYDAAGVLQKVSDNLTNTEISFNHNNNLRLISITRSNGVNTTLTYNDTDRLTRIQHGNIADIKTTFNASGEIISQEKTLPLDITDVLNNRTHNFAYDDSSEAEGNGIAYDKRGRLTAVPDHSFVWDVVSMLTSLDGKNFIYNDSGGLIEDTDGTNTNYYYYNFAIAPGSIMAEKDKNSTWKYYVYTPQGHLLYMIDTSDNNKVYFYHFDRRGSTICLTDITGKITDAYSYMPYGELIQHQGSNPQPFTFLGQWGVRQITAKGRFFQTGARVYDSEMARFISRDPVWPELTEAAELNPYQYGLDEPVRHIDITGLASKKERELAALKAKFEQAKARFDSISPEFLDKLNKSIHQAYSAWFKQTLHTTAATRTKYTALGAKWGLKAYGLLESLAAKGTNKLAKWAIDTDLGIPDLGDAAGKVGELAGEWEKWEKEKEGDLRKVLALTKRKYDELKSERKELRNYMSRVNSLMDMLNNHIKRQARQRAQQIQKKRNCNCKTVKLYQVVKKSYAE